MFGEIYMKNRIIKIKDKYNSYFLKNDCDYLKYEYPNLVINSIGKSTLGEDIYCLRLGIGKKHLLLHAGFYANESITSLICMLWVEKFLACLKKQELYKGYDLMELWDKVSIFIIPMANPDGINLVLGDKLTRLREEYYFIWKNYENNLEFWKSNIRGVNLMLNYPYSWEKYSFKLFKIGIVKPCPSAYPGPNCLSEVETKNIYNFIRFIDINKIISISTYGEKKQNIDAIYMLNKLDDYVLKYADNNI